MTPDEVLRQSLQQPSVGQLPATGEAEVVSPTPIRFNQQLPQVARPAQRQQFPSQTTTTPYQIVAPTTATTGSVSVKVNKQSYLRPDSTTIDGGSPLGLDTDFTIAAGDYVWIQIDTSDGLTVSESSIQHGTAPLGTDGNPFGDLVTIAGSGTFDDPFIWDQSFLPIAQVLSSTGTATHGGRLFRAGSTTLEVVQLVNYNVAMRPVLSNGVWARMAFPDSRPNII